MIMKFTSLRHTLIPPFTILFLLSLQSCGSDGSKSSDDCSIHEEVDKATFFDRGDYSFSCMDDGGSVSIEFPVLAENHEITPTNENAVKYILSTRYTETEDETFSPYLFSHSFAKSLSDEETVIDGLGDQASFFTIPEESRTRHYIIFRDCNFIGTIAGEYPNDESVPCNLGKDQLVAFAREMLNNI